MGPRRSHAESDACRHNHFGKGTPNRVPHARVALHYHRLCSDGGCAFQLHIRPLRRRITPLWSRSALDRLPVRRFANAPSLVHARAGQRHPCWAASGSHRTVRHPDGQNPGQLPVPSPRGASVAGADSGSDRQRRSNLRAAGRSARAAPHLACLFSRFRRCLFDCHVAFRRIFTRRMKEAGMKPNWITTLIVAALIGIAGYAALFLAPTERTMGLIQRIFYFHVPSAWAGFVAFFITFIASVAYLLRRAPKWDWLAVSSAEVGVAFFTVVLVTGPIWAKPVWGIWWTWDARLTSTFVLWVLYLSYLLLRTLVTDAERRAVVSAVFGIFAFLDVPLVYMSIRWWRTQHPQPVIAGGSGSGLDPQMWRVFLTCWAALLGVLIVLLRQRYQLESLRHTVEEMTVEAERRNVDRERIPFTQAVR